MIRTSDLMTIVFEVALVDAAAERRLKGPALEQDWLMKAKA